MAHDECMHMTERRKGSIRKRRREKSENGYTSTDGEIHKQRRR
jgi:hypothetical protein